MGGAFDTDAPGPIHGRSWTSARAEQTSRSACKDATDLCLGDLAAGNYRSTFLDLRTAATDQVTDHGAYGELAYAVPDGWANSGDWPFAYDLVPSDVYATAGSSGVPDGSHGIYVQSRPVAALQDETCSGADAPGVGRSLEALTAWIVDHPGLVVSPSRPAIVGSHRATMVDVSLDPGWTATCLDVPDGAPIALLFHQEGASEPTWGIGGYGEEHQRLILVELAPDNVVLIGIVSIHDQASFEALLAEAMPIVESFEFPE